MNSILHRSIDRGQADHGWLVAKHSFSFAGYYDASKVHFGALRVLNDDIVAAGMGFGTHPHDNMEIITIPLSGTLRHKDSMGNEGDINYGDVQVMSAGNGIEHSEFNPNKAEQVKLLQIWIFSKEKDITPRYDQQSFDLENKVNEWTNLVVPYGEKGMYIHQDAWFTFGQFEAGTSSDYAIRKSGNGVYFFVIDGEVEINGKILNQRDAIGITETDSVDLKFRQKTRILAIDVPMQW
jgi:quercetin 2,3-dioxygenase